MKSKTYLSKTLTQAQCDRVNALREYDAAHKVWMNTSVFSPIAAEVRKNLDNARNAYSAALEKLKCVQCGSNLRDEETGAICNECNLANLIEEENNNKQNRKLWTE